MAESRCGLLCKQCEYKTQGCPGCLAIKKPFWGEKCPVKNCCEANAHDHCGQCPDFPCSLLIQFAYDRKQGDGGKRLRHCLIWVTSEPAKKITRWKFFKR
ncbi:MAG: DUF3795 domain-containing protein [Christensenellaceae bacterium]